MKIGRLEITASRWPWQAGYGWTKVKSPHAFAPLNNGARFGGGWHYCLGVRIGGSTVLFELLFGMIRFTWLKRGEL